MSDTEKKGMSWSSYIAALSLAALFGMAIGFGMVLGITYTNWVFSL